MNHKCIICDKVFENDELLKKHVDEHLSESVLSKPRDEFVDTGYSFKEENGPVDFKKIFSEEKFERLVESKINKISDVQEIINRRSFVEEIKKLVKKIHFVIPVIFLMIMLMGCLLMTFKKNIISGFGWIYITLLIMS